MTVGILTIIGATLIGWYRSYAQARHLRRDRRVLIAQNERLIELHRQKDAAITPPTRPRVTPSARAWPDANIDRLAADVGLKIVPDRESHSHAESSQRKDPA